MDFLTFLERRAIIDTIKYWQTYVISREISLERIEREIAKAKERLREFDQQHSILT